MSWGISRQPPQAGKPRQSHPAQVFPPSSSQPWGPQLVGTLDTLCSHCLPSTSPVPRTANTTPGQPPTWRSRAATRFICSQSRRLAASASSACGGKKQAHQDFRAATCMVFTAALRLAPFTASAVHMYTLPEGSLGNTRKRKLEPPAPPALRSSHEALCAQPLRVQHGGTST